MTVGVRVAGQVPIRVDLRFARKTEQRPGLSLVTVLVYLWAFPAARTVASAWGQAAPMARSLSPVLPGVRRPVVATGPWETSTMVRMSGAPMVDSTLLPARPGTNLPTMLRVQIGAGLVAACQRGRIQGPASCVKPGGRSSRRIVGREALKIELWMVRASRRRAGPRRVGLLGVEWWICVLRSDSKNIAWTCRGAASEWTSARRDAIAALQELVAVEGRQECRVRIDGQDGIVTPGLSADGHVALADLDGAILDRRYYS